METKEECNSCKKERTTNLCLILFVLLVILFIIVGINIIYYDAYRDNFSPNQKMAEMCYECMGDTNITAVAHCYLGTQLSSERRIFTTIRCSLKKMHKEVTGNSSPE